MPDHRADAELTANSLTPFDLPFAVDGIDELLLLTSGPGRGLMHDPPATIAIEPSDAPVAWLIHARPDGNSVSRVKEGAPAPSVPSDCTVRAPTPGDISRSWKSFGPRSAAAAKAPCSRRTMKSAGRTS